MPNRPFPLLLLAVGTILTLTGCNSRSNSGEAIDRDLFVTTWAELRLAELGSSGGELPTTRRDSILAAHGVDDDDLVTFAEVHGDDPAFMAAVWDDVVARMDPDTMTGPRPASN